VQGINWLYTNDYRKAYSEYETCIDLEASDESIGTSLCIEPADTVTDTQGVEAPIQVVSEFQKGGVAVPYSQDTAFEILAYTVPARTESLGQALMPTTTGEINFNESMGGFSNSNQDHSAPFHVYYSEISLESPVQQRAIYWKKVLSESLGFKTDNNFTGLKK